MTTQPMTIELTRREQDTLRATLDELIAEMTDSVDRHDLDPAHREQIAESMADIESVASKLHHPRSAEA
jgi:hypothetical protein